MADLSELKHMVMSFRVSELQVLLGYAGRNKTGRKTELLSRALQLLQKGCSVPIQIKIRELYNQIFGSNRRKPTASKPGEDGPHNCPMDYSNRMMNHDPSPHGSSLGMLPVHPDVKLKHLPFYDCITELMKPTSLVPRGSTKFQDNHYNFHLTPQQAQDIAMSRDFRPGARCEYTTQIQLRFGLLETSCEQDDHFPPSICVRVNGKMAPLPNPIPTNKPGVEPKRPGRPVDITPLCRLSPTLPNQIEVSWAADFGRGFFLAIFLVKKLTSDILLVRLKQFGNRHADHTRALIKEKLSHDPDSEIATTSLRVSLICPLGKMRMTIPTRASTCTHLQCFDGSTFLMMNEKKSTWICPVCDKPAPFHRLFIDGLFVEILQKTSDMNEIQFHEDGSWSPLKAFKEPHVISCSPAAHKSSQSESRPSASSSSPSSSGPAPKKPKMEVIDLTVSSDEDTDSDSDSDSPQPMSLNAFGGDSSPNIISLDSPTPAPSTASPSCDSPMVASPSSNSNSSSSSSSSSSSGTPKQPSSPQKSRPGTPVSAPLSAPQSVSSLSPAHSSRQSTPALVPSPCPLPSPSPPGQPLIHSPLGIRISPVTPPSSTPILPPFQPIPAPVSLPTPAFPHFPPPPQIQNYDPNLDREIEDFLRGIVWDQYR
ncbi:E3 SUMO-protein ligase PIAS2-like isoform X3 [Ostrea edulis]|uniref:E3 SUMO-protein ligase PIAS2-like isoform X3 n=1 Tax=Ostrea edulis TaxID=37623 RepID=UPI0024AF79C6|nr:E3 SUMO-protein ligase PIAS2-like isoform X3 [Ostrea edulis]